MLNADEKSPYLKPGRLPDVIAALQVMAAGERPEAKIHTWANELSRSEDADEIERWRLVFVEHREFFLTYKLKDDPTLKAALRWRYTNRLYDPKENKEYTNGEKAGLALPIRDRLTTKPLSSEAIGTLIAHATELHKRAIEEQTARRWWVPLFSAGLGAAGAIVVALITALLKDRNLLPGFF